MKRPNGYDNLFKESVNIGGENFCFVEAKRISVSTLPDQNWANDSTIWIRPQEGWDSTDIFGDMIPICKIDWESQTMTVAIALAGNGITAHAIVATIGFSKENVMSIDAFKQWISKSHINCNINK